MFTLGSGGLCGEHLDLKVKDVNGRMATSVSTLHRSNSQNSFADKILIENLTVQ